jgi:hypothetical protein
VSSNLEVLISLGFKKGEIAELDNVIKKLRELEAKGVKLADVTTKAESQKESRDTRKTMEDIKESLFKQKVETDNTDVLNEIGKLDSNISQLQYNLFAHAIFPKSSDVGTIESLQAKRGNVREMLGEMVKNKDRDVLGGLSQEEYVDRYTPMMERIIDNTTLKLMRGMSSDRLERPLSVIDMLSDPRQAGSFFSLFKKVAGSTYGKEEPLQREFFGLLGKGRNIKTTMENQGLQLNMLEYTAAMQGNEVPGFNFKRENINESVTNKLQDWSTKQKIGEKTLTKDEMREFLPITGKNKQDASYKQFSGTMLLDDKLYEDLKVMQEKELKNMGYDKDEITAIMKAVFVDKVPDIMATIIDKDKFEKATVESLTEAYMKQYPKAYQKGIEQFFKLLLENRDTMKAMQDKGFTGVTIFPMAMEGTQTKFWEELTKNPALYKILQKNLLSFNHGIGTNLDIIPTSEEDLKTIKGFTKEQKDQLTQNQILGMIEDLKKLLVTTEDTNKTVKTIDKDSNRM